MEYYLKSAAISWILSFAVTMWLDLKVYENNVSLFKYKNFKDFDYLSVDMPNWALISAGLLIWGVLNEFKN